MRLFNKRDGRKKSFFKTLNKSVSQAAGHGRAKPTTKVDDA